MCKKTRKIWLLLMAACGMVWSQENNQPAKTADAAPAEAEKAAVQTGAMVEKATLAETKPEAAAENKNEADTENRTEAAAPAVQKPVGPQDDVPVSQLYVTEIHRLPEVNFANVDSLQWSADGKRLIIDRFRGQAYQVAIVQIPENLSEKRFPEQIITETSRRSMLLNHGKPVWYPVSNRYAVYVSQMTQCRDYKQTLPSNGQNCNLLITDLGRRSMQTLELTTLPYSLRNPQGVTSPCFSPDGRILAWCGSNGKSPDVSMWGSRSLYLGDFVIQRGIPKLKNIRQLRNVGTGDYFNCYGVSADNYLLYGTNTVKNAPWYTADIMLMDLNTKQITNLTNAPNCWDNYASFSPNGQKIIWSSSIGQTVVNLGKKGEKWQQEVISELYIMDVKGAEKKRLTMFNTRDTRDMRIVGLTTYEHCYVGASSWNPKKNQIAVVVYRRGSVSSVYLLEVASIMSGN